MSQIKIAITGKMGSGKSTITKLIKEIEKDAFITSYSSVIRKILQDLDLVPTRDIMQATGDFFRKFDMDVWTNALLKEINGITNTIVIEGLRYSFERDKLVLNGFKVLKIDTPDELRKKRIEIRDKIAIDDNLWSNWQHHPTELFVDQIKVDFRILNNTSLSRLKELIDTILNQVRLNNQI